MSYTADAPIRFERNNVASANETYRADFPVPIGDSSTNKGIGKKDKTAGNGHPNNDQYLGLSDTAILKDSSGTSTNVVAEDLNLISRSVASCEVSRLIGSNAIASESYARHNQENIGVSAFSSGCSVTEEEGTICHQFNFADPNIQKGLYDLEAVDYLTGQIDRHAGNIFIDHQTGQVQGIDNDLAFGSKPLSAAVQDPAIGGKAVGNPPYFYHQETADAIEALSPEQLRETLESVSDPDGNHRLSKPEIDACVQRLETMKSSITLARAQGRVVQQFDNATFQASMQQHQQNAGPRLRGSPDHAITTSYVGRAQARLDLAIAGEGGLKVKAPTSPAPDAYKQNIQRGRELLSDAKKDAALKPDLSPRRREVAELEQVADSLRSRISSAIQSPEGQSRIQASRAIAEKANQSYAANLQRLQNIKDDKPTLTAEDCKALKVLNIEANVGEKLDPARNSQLSSRLRKAVDQQPRIAKDKIEKAELNAANGLAVEDRAALQATLAQLNQAKQKLQAEVDNDPNVIAVQSDLADQITEKKMEFLGIPKQVAPPAVAPPVPSNSNRGILSREAKAIKDAEIKPDGQQVAPPVPDRSNRGVLSREAKAAKDTEAGLEAKPNSNREAFKFTKPQARVEGEDSITIGRKPAPAKVAPPVPPRKLS